MAHHDDATWTLNATEMKASMVDCAAGFFINTKDELKCLIDDAMKKNDTPQKQSFSGVTVSAKADTFFSRQKPFVYAYLTSIDHKNSTGVIKYHLLYDTVENEEGQLIPITSGAFEITKKLPFSGGMIPNPWLCPSAAKYLEKTWLKEAALWSHAPIALLRKAVKKHVYDNDQHMEGVFSNIKAQPDRHMNCDEPAMYIWSRWKDTKACARTFVADYERMGATIDSRKESFQEPDMTEDARENNAFMTEDSIWDTGESGKKYELKLQRQLKGILWRKFGKKQYTKWHSLMKLWIQDQGVGSLQGMEYNNFRAWMNNQRNTDKPINSGALSGMKHFVKYYDQNHEGSDTQEKCDEDDK